MDRTARLPSLRVLARSTAFQFRNQVDVRRVARDLEVDGVLEGSLRQGDRDLRITVQLVNGHDGYRVFSETYTVPDQHPELVEEKVGELVEARVTALLRGPRPAAAVAPEQDLETRSLITRASHLAERRTGESLQSSIADAGEAIRRSPASAAAHAVLADALVSYSDFRPRAETSGLIARAESEASEALRIAPDLAGPYAVLAAIRMNHNWDLREAERLFRRAITLNPNHAASRTRYSRLLTITGKFDAALEQAQTARLIDPLSVNSVANVGHVQYFSRHYEASLEPLRRALELDSSYRNGHLTLSRVFALMGRITEARSHLVKARELLEDLEYTACAAYVEGLGGDQAQARALLHKIEAGKGRQSLSSIALVAAYAAAGESAKALDHLETAVRSKDPDILYMPVSPALDRIRQEPRFQSALAASGLSQPAR